jgi:hypothetical protein
MDRPKRDVEREHRELVDQLDLLTHRIRLYLTSGEVRRADNPDPGGLLADAIIGLLAQSWRGLTKGGRG